MCGVTPRRTSASPPATIDPALFREFAWRPIGPFSRAGAGATAQPTGAFDHVVTDAAFPYRVCGASSDGRAVCVSSRGGTNHDALPDRPSVRSGDASYVAPDPNDPDIVYLGRLARYDRRTAQVQDVAPFYEGGTTGIAAPLVYSPADGRTLFFASTVVWQTETGGEAWAAISPDLTLAGTGATRGADPADAVPAAHGAAAISALVPSAIDADLIWAGASNGVIHVTRDLGHTWTNVTPAQVAAARIVALEASHFDVNTAYAVVDASAAAPHAPALFRTRDGGRTWTLITHELADAGRLYVVKEDAQRRGLLFAGADAGPFVSFDDGDSWQPLRLNLPSTPVRDVTIKDSDVILSTGGLGFWVLDDIMPLRQITPDVASARAFLFSPGVAWRARWRTDVDAADSRDERTAATPPDGVPISYLLGQAVQLPVSLEILDAQSGDVLRRYSSDAVDDAPLATSPGLHRIVWDLRYAPPASSPAAGVRSPAHGAWALPGAYQVRLTVGGRSYRQAVLVKLDRRVGATAADLAQELALSQSLSSALDRVAAAQRTLEPDGASAGALAAAYGTMSELFSTLQRADARPTAAIANAAKDAVERANAALAHAKDPSSP